VSKSDPSKVFIVVEEQTVSANKPSSEPLYRYLLHNVKHNTYFIFQAFHFEGQPQFRLNKGEAYYFDKEEKINIAQGWLWGPVTNDDGWFLANRPGQSWQVKTRRPAGLEVLFARKANK